MRASTRFASVALGLAAIACAPSAKTDAAKDDFKRDLQLASATNMDLAAPAVNTALLTSLETAPASTPAPVKVIKKAEAGPLAVQSEAPTVAATPEPTPAPVEQVAEPVATVAAPAPAPVDDEPVAVAPRAPAPVAPAGGAGAGDYGRGGGVYGGGIGVVIRGGGVDGDHCEIRPRRGGVIFRSPVYVPQMGTGGSAPSYPTTRGVTIVRR